MNYRTVSLKFVPDVRVLYKKLSYSHFATVAALERPEAWLEKAENGGWSVESLRSEVNKAYQGLKTPELTEKPPEVYKCKECGLWRLRDMSSFDICRGHYVYKEGGRIDYE